jgi:serine/threonine-protein kinase
VTNFCFGDGRYRVVEAMGASETRAVFLTEHAEQGRKLVVQQLQPSATAIERARFLDESERIRALAHPHIIEAIEMGDADGQPYVVFEHLVGSSLADELARRGSFPVQRVVHIVRQIGAALGAAHVEGIVHGGVGLASVFLVERGADRSFVKLLGFGAGDRPDVPAPEQVQGVAIDERSDIWSVGALLYRMLTGHAPFSGAPGSPAWRKAIVEAEPIELLRTDVGDELREVIARCLAKDPADRYEDMAELVAALAPFERRLARGSASSTIPPPIVSIAPRDEVELVRTVTARFAAVSLPERRTYWHFVAIGAAALAGCILGAFLV